MRWRMRRTRRSNRRKQARRSRKGNMRLIVRMKRG